VPPWLPLPRIAEFLRLVRRQARSRRWLAGYLALPLAMMVLVTAVAVLRAVDRNLGLAEEVGRPSSLGALTEIAIVAAAASLPVLFWALTREPVGQAESLFALLWRVACWLGVVAGGARAVLLALNLPGAEDDRGPGASLLSAGVLAATALGFVAAQRGDESPVAPWVDARLDAMPAGTKVLNDWELGHWALWRHPQLALVMHGYVDVFTVDELQRNIRIATLAPEWDREVEELGVDVAVVDPDSQLGYALTELLGWTVVEGDDDFVLLTPPAS